MHRDSFLSRVSAQGYPVTKTSCWPFKCLASSAICTAPVLGLWKLSFILRSYQISTVFLKTFSSCQRWSLWSSLQFPLVSNSKERGKPVCHLTQTNSTNTRRPGPWPWQAHKAAPKGDGGAELKRHSRGLGVGPKTATPALSRY